MEFAFFLLYTVNLLKHFHCKVHQRMIPCNYTLKRFSSALTPQIPIVDIGSLIHGADDPSVIEDVCIGANVGAFQVINHGINVKEVGI